MTLVEWKKPVNGQVNRNVYGHPFHGLWDLLGNEFFAKEQASFVPAVNIAEEDQTYKLEFSAPGYSKEDFTLTAEKGVLTVSAQHSENKEVKEKKFTRKEFSYGSFKRSFKLPEAADDAAIAAKYENGILTVEIPKKEKPANEARQITVN